MKFSERLKMARARLGIKAEEISNEMGVKAHAYQVYEAPGTKQLPSLTRAAELARIMKVSLDFLGGLTEDPTPRWDVNSGATVNTEFRERLKAARTRAKLKIREVAALLGMKENTYLSYEAPSKAQIPSVERAARMAKALDVSLDYLGGLTEDPTPMWKYNPVITPDWKYEDSTPKPEPDKAVAVEPSQTMLEDRLARMEDRLARTEGRLARAEERIAMLEAALVAVGLLKK